MNWKLVLTVVVAFLVYKLAWDKFVYPTLTQNGLMKP